jgi:hypothetical protein
MKDLPLVTPPVGIFAFRGTVADVDGDSFDDLLLPDSDGQWKLIANRAGKLQDAAITWPGTGSAALGTLRPTWLSAAGKLNLVGVTRAGGVSVQRTPASNWLEVKWPDSKQAWNRKYRRAQSWKFHNKLLVQGDRGAHTGDLKA